jgi:putative phage-type endonuclease
MTDIMLTDYETRPKWLAARMNGIGASESAALFGISPWSTTLKLWALKTGKLPQEDFTADREWLDWGNILEPLIANRYAEVTGSKIWQGGPYCIAQHQTIPIMFATPDRMVIESPTRRARGSLQVKNASAYKYHDWQEGPPDFVECQVQHEMAVLDLEWAAVAVLIGGNQFRYFDVERNGEFITELEEQVKWFWQLVQRRQQPPMDEVDARSLETLKKLHPADNGEIVTLSNEAIEWWNELESARKATSAAKKQSEQFSAKLRAAIGDATYAVLPDGRRLSLKTTDTAGSVTPPGRYRTLKLEKEGKRP